MRFLDEGIERYLNGYFSDVPNSSKFPAIGGHEEMKKSNHNFTYKL